MLRTAAALGLDEGETDELLVSAGYWPVAFIAPRPGDATLRKLAGALSASWATVPRAEAPPGQRRS